MIDQSLWNEGTVAVQRETVIRGLAHAAAAAQALALVFFYLF
jgi:hypothetical protein